MITSEKMLTIWLQQNLDQVFKNDSLVADIDQFIDLVQFNNKVLMLDETIEIFQYLLSKIDSKTVDLSLIIRLSATKSKTTKFGQNLVEIASDVSYWPPLLLFETKKDSQSIIENNNFFRVNISPHILGLYEDLFEAVYFTYLSEEGCEWYRSIECKPRN